MANGQQRRRQKKRRNQRKAISRLIEQLIAKDQDEAGEESDPNRKISREELAAADLRGLCSEESLEIFLVWYSFGGMQRGLSLLEAAELPATLRRDVSYILSELHKARKRQAKSEEEKNQLAAKNKRPKAHG